VEQAFAEYILIQGIKIHLIKDIFIAITSWQLEMTYHFPLPWFPTENNDSITNAKLTARCQQLEENICCGTYTSRQRAQGSRDELL